MKNKVFPFLFLSILIPATAHAADIQILYPGVFHSNEVKTGTKGTWWAVCAETELKQSLKPVTVQTRRVRDEVVDQGNEKTGIEVSVSGCKDVRFLLRGIPLKQKDLMLGGLEVQSEQDLKNGKLTATFNGKPYTFQNSKVGESGYRIDLIGPTQKQTLHEAPQADTDSALGWRVEWVGDLDGDQKPDFFIQASDHYNVGIKRLFLSSRAKPGKLVEQVASFTSTGC